MFSSLAAVVGVEVLPRVRPKSKGIFWKCLTFNVNAIDSMVYAASSGDGASLCSSLRRRHLQLKIEIMLKAMKVT